MQIIIAFILGIIAGTVTGLLPGIHINLVAALLLGSLDKFTYFPVTSLVIFIIALAIAHTLIDFIPSIYLGAPNEDTFLTILPGHELLKEGKGHEAVIIALLGAISSLIILIPLIFVFLKIAPIVQNKITLFVPFILLFISTYMILRERNIVIPLIVFILSGFLGFVTLNLPIEQPLLPLLTGLFGLSNLIISIKEKTKITKQKKISIKKVSLTRKDIKNAIKGLFISGPIFSFLPALGSGYASLISSELFEQSKKGFIFLVGAMNTLIMSASFILIYSIGKARTGAAAAILTLLKEPSSIMLNIIVPIIIAGIVSFFIAILISKMFATLITKVNYNLISIFVILVLLIVNIYFSNFIGLIVLITATSLGIFAIKSNIKRTHLMGCLIIPTILFYLF